MKRKLYKLNMVYTEGRMFLTDISMENIDDELISQVENMS